MVILTGLGLARGQAAAVPGYEVYQLNHKPAAEIQKVLADLLRKQAPQSDLLVDAGTNRLLVRGPVEAQTIARQLIDSLDRPSAAAASSAPPSAATSGKFVGLKSTRVERVESTLREVLGAKLKAREGPQPHLAHYWIMGAAGPVGEIVVDRQRNGLGLFGSEPLTRQLAQLAAALETAALEPQRSVRIVPIRNADPAKIRQAYEAYRTGYRGSERSPAGGKAGNSAGSSSPDRGRAPAATDQGRVIPHGGVRQVAYLFQAEGVGGGPEGSAPSNAEPRTMDEQMRDVGVDVEIETLPDLDVIIVRGRERDVDEVTRLIEEIERLSALAEPMIEVYPLKHVGGQRLVALVEEVEERLIGSRQGWVSVTPLVKPNALLLIGWGEAVRAVKELISKLDRPVEAATQSRIFRLQHSAASQVAATIQSFFGTRQGMGPEVSVTPDPRTNSILVYASPRDMEEVGLLVSRLDTDQSRAVTHGRIFKVNNALATDLAATLQGAIDAARGRTAADKSTALELLTVDAAGQRLLRSGLLDDVTIMPDPHTNTLFISGPVASMELIAALINELDTPAAVAQIKVFRIINSDANALALMLRTLLPTSTPGGLAPQLAGAENETALVPVRFAVEPRTNTIIATGSAGDLAIIEALLLRLDAEEQTLRINKVYRLKNSPAEYVATSINDFLLRERQVQAAAPGFLSPFQQLETEAIVVAEPVSNALIISATPRFFEEIEQLVEELDAEPPQVVIQVLIAEVALTDDEEFGVELGLQDSLLFDRSVVLANQLVPGFNFNNQPLGNSGTNQSLATAGQAAGQALSHFAVGRTNSDFGYGGLVLSASSESVSVLIRALKQSGRLDILSRPQIMTLDNQPAFIQVGKRVPRVTGSTITTRGQVNNIVLENVGLILGVTPRISPEGLVVMEIDAEKSDLSRTEQIAVAVTEGQPIFSPVINLATAQTTVSAADGHTVVLGGLISKNTSTLRRRVPFLSDVPVLGALFRYDTEQTTRAELLILLTPHVVRSSEDADRIKRIEAARIDWSLADVYDIQGPIGLESEAVIYPDTNPRGVIPGPEKPDVDLDKIMPLDDMPIPAPLPNDGQSARPSQSNAIGRAEVPPQPQRTASRPAAASPEIPPATTPPDAAEPATDGVRVRFHPLPAEPVPTTLDAAGPQSIRPAAHYLDGRTVLPPYPATVPDFYQQP